MQDHASPRRSSAAQFFNPALKTAAAFILAMGVAAHPARAALYLTGSVSSSTNNVPYTAYASRAASGSIAFDLGSHIRLGYTHRQELSLTEGWEKNNPSSSSPQVVTDVEGNVFTKSYDSKHVTSNSLDLTIILYEGQIFVPYLVAGAVVKTYNFSSHKGPGTPKITTKLTMPPVPNVGAGIDFRINREFSLRFSYVASPGYAQEPNEDFVKVWDRYTTVGLTYRI